ncbi:DUF2019 domain-containing protein [Pseudarthrobacter chlorophenolicus]|uniref:DUF2019 domain-containing protein n=1 Tax=Pseudarthrobacter chlorophenolicus TaxID=85085 RepID=UPI0005F29AFC
MGDPASLLSEYEELAVAWNSETNSGKANKIFDRIHALALQLRSGEEGKQGLERLLCHPVRGVRLKAAADCLAWNSSAAVTALEDLLTPRGTHSLSAEMTLREYRAGRMRFDW